MRPRIFLGSSGKQAKLVHALTRGLAEVAEVEPWTAVFNPGVSTLDRLVELTREVDFAAFVFAQDDWTSNPSDATAQGQASPRDNVVFEAGVFGGALGMRRTFILHAKAAKLPTDLVGMTAVRYPEALTAADMRAVNQKLRKAIEEEGRLTRPEGDWWQHSLTLRSEREPSAISLLRISRDREGGLEIAGRSWQEDGTLSARYWSEASKEHRDPRASSTSGRANDRGTRTPPSSRARARSAWSLPIEPRATGPLGPTPTPSFASGRPASTCAPIRTTCESSTAVTHRRVPSCSRCAFGSGRRFRTRSSTEPGPMGYCGHSSGWSA
jgi:hypothetical protein